MSETKLNFTDEYVFTTLQGEGKFTGVPSTFVRLSGCNLRCTWKNSDGSETTCDTPFSSFKPDRNVRTIIETVREINKYSANHVVVTGGEPYMQKGLSELIYELKNSGKIVTVETNGTIFFNTEADFISLSPKLRTSANGKFAESQEKRRLNFESLTRFVLAHNCQFKFVANTPDDIKEIKDILLELAGHIATYRRNLKTDNTSSTSVLIETKNTLKDLNSRVWLMPQGISPEQIGAKSVWLWEECVKQNWNMSQRLHILTWGSKRGV